MPPGTPPLVRADTDLVDSHQSWSAARSSATVP